MKLVFATHNVNKFEEVKALTPKGIHLLSLIDIGCLEDIEETGSTLEENAQIKARYVYEKYKLNCFADDTGLEVEALNNAPGVYSARYAGKNVTYDDNVLKLLQNMKYKKNRNARFKTSVAIILGGEERLLEGVVNGVITKEKRGDKGFGYDPVFLPNGFLKTFAEMTFGEKNEISHRALAIKALINHLNKIVNI